MKGEFTQIKWEKGRKAERRKGRKDRSKTASLRLCAKYIFKKVFEPRDVERLPSESATKIIT